MRDWGVREWGVATIGSALALVLLGLPTVLIPNGIFAREIEPTWWSYPVWLATAILSGLVLLAVAFRSRLRANSACPSPPPRPANVAE